MHQAVRPLPAPGPGAPPGAPLVARARALAAWATTRRGAAVALVGLLGLSLALRLEGQQVWFWIDEGLSAGIAGHPLAEIPGVLRQDGSPPLYYLLLHGWMQAFGDGEVALHAFSLVFALACVPAALWAGWSLLGPRVGWIAAVLAATNPFLTYYGREARMYTLVAFLALLAAACFAHAFAFGRRRYLVPFAVLLTLLLYTHNWALFFAGGAGLALVPCLAARPRDERVGIVRDAALAFGAAALLYLPWVPTLASQIAHTGAPWSRVPMLRELVSELDAVLGDERVLVALLLAGGAGIAVLVRQAGPRRLGALGALLVIGIAPLVASWITSQVEPNWATRYFAIIVGAVLLVAAAGLSRAGWQGLAALGLILLFWTQPLGRITGARPAVPREHKSNVKQIMAAAAPELSGGDLVVSTHGEQVPVLRYYLPDGLRYATATGPVEDPGVFDWRDVVDRMERATPERNLLPLIDRLAPGGRVLFVGPVGELTGDRDPHWFVLFHRRTDEWIAALGADPRLRLDARIGSPDDEVPGTSVFALLFTKTAP